MASFLPMLTEGIVQSDGKISPSWYRYFARLERILGDGAPGAGDGLAIDADGEMTIDAGGVTSAMLRDSPACSLIGRSVNSSGVPQDILATANQHFLQRDGDSVLFRVPKLPSYTVATVPNALDVGAGTIIYVSDEVGGAVVAFSDATNWLRVTDRAIIS